MVRLAPSRRIRRAFYLVGLLRFDVAFKVLGFLLHLIGLAKRENDRNANEQRNGD